MSPAVSRSKSARPRVPPSRRGRIIYSLARHPKWGTVHFVLFDYSDEWRIACTGDYLEETWAKAVNETAQVTCQRCWSMNWDGNATRKDSTGTWWCF